MAEAVKPLLPLWVRRILYGVATVLVLIALGIGTAWLLMKSPFGEALVGDALVGTLNQNTDMTLSIADIDGDLPSSITFMDLSVRDLQGQWLTIDRLFVSWKPWTLLTGRVVVNTVIADTVTLERMPLIPTNSRSGPPVDLDGLAILLARLRVESLEVKRLNTFYAIDDESLSAAVTAHLEPDDSGRPRLTVDIAGLARGGVLSASAALGQRQTVVMSAEGSLEGASFKANGSFNTRTDALTGKAEGVLVPGVVPPINGVNFKDATFNVDLSGTLDKPQLRTSYVVTQPRFNTTDLNRLDGTAEAVWNGRVLSLDVAGGLNDILPLAPGLESVLRPDALYAVTATLDPMGGENGAALASVSEASLESGDVAATFSGTVDLGSFVGRGQASVSGTGLARLAGWPDDASQTTLQFDISEVSPNGLNATVSGSSANMTASSSILTALVDGPIVYEGTVRVDAGQIAITDLSAVAPNFSISGGGNLLLAEQSVSAEITSGALTLDALSDDLSGRVSMAGTFAGPMAIPRLTMRIRSQEVAVRQEVFQDVDLTLSSDLAQSPMRLAVDGAVRVAEGPLALDLEATLDAAQSVTLSPLSVTGAGISLTGSLAIGLSDSIVTGAMKASFETLAVPSALLGVPLSGAAEVSLVLASEDGVQDVTWTAQANALRYDGAGAALGVLETSGRWIGGDDPAIDASIDGGNGFVGNQPISDVVVRAVGPLSALSITAGANAPDDGLAVSLSAEVSLAQDQTSLSLMTFDIKDSWGSAVLAESAGFLFSPDRVVADAVNLTINGGSARASLVLDKSASTVTASLTAEQLPFAVLETLESDLSVSGHFGVTVELNGPLASPSGRFTFKTNDVSLPDTGLEGVGADLTGALDGQRLTVSARVTGLSDVPATITGSIPLVINLADSQARLPLEQPMDLAVSWSGAIEPLWSVLPLINHRLSGTANVDFTLSGTLGAPILAGYVRLADGTYENLDIGTLFRDLNAELTAEDVSTLTFSAAANDADDGTLSGTGRLTRNGDSEFSGDLSFTMDNTRLVRRDDVKVRGSGTMTYVLTPDRDRLEGDVQVESAEVSLNASYVEPVVLLDVVDPSAPAPNGGVVRVGKETDLAVRLTAPRGIDVVGRGLDSEWTADVLLGGTLAAPELEGSLDVLRGEFSFLGELFDLTRGQVLFTGGGKIDPDLSVVAERTTGGITAMLEVAGRASSPNITLASDPALPQDEILSRIIFGKSAGQLGPLEALQLANAAVELTGLAGRGGVVGTLRRSVGLDVFRFGSDAGGSTIVVGERLSKNIFVGVEQGLEGQGSQVIIEWQLTNNLALKSTARQDTGSDIGLRWSRDY